MKVLNDYMDRKGLTQVDMAAVLGISQGQLNNWLTGKRKPAVVSLKLISAKTGISLEKLARDL